MKTALPVEKSQFENSIEKLESIVKSLESGDLSLEDSIKSFEEGVQLASFCGKKLEEAQKKVEILLSKNGEPVKEPFNS